ncbi:hypothetical protein [Fructilactobacillus frigidiflavus]|uniref:hypothetical protein n=1 Tax=Fructilactobacillus frigidiflavus TaxID=3242688 RepID=UPI00375640F7
MLNKKLTELIKVNLLYSNPSNTQKQRKKGKNLTQIAQSTLIWAFLTGFLLLGLFGVSLISVDLPKSPGIFTHFLGLFTLLLMAQLISTINNVFLDNQDFQNYLSLPVKMSTLWTAKLATTALTMIPFAIPLLAILIMTACQSNYNVVIAIVVAITTFMLYFGAILVLTSLLTFLITQNRFFQAHKQLGNSILLGVSTIAIVVGCVVLSVSQNKPHPNDENILTPLAPIFNLITHPFSLNSLLTLVILIGVTGGGALILRKLSDSKLLQVKKLPVSKSKAASRPVVQKSLLQTLLRYNLQLIRDPSFMTQSLANTIMMPFVFLFGFSYGSKDLMSHLGWEYAGVFFLLGVMFSFMTFNSYALVGNIISLDGANFEMMRSFPIKFSYYLKIKFWLATIIQIILMIILTIAIGSFIHLKIELLLPLIAGIILSQLAGCLYYFTRDWRLLSLNWTNPTQLLSRGLGNWGVFMMTFGSMFFGGLLIGLIALLTNYFPLFINLLVLIMIMVSTFIVYRHYQKTFWQVVSD